MNISKYALNHLGEFIVIGSFYLKCIDTENLIASSGTAQSIAACTRLRSRPASSLRVCISRLDLKQHSVQSSYLKPRLSISHLDARTGFLESLSTRSYCNGAHMFVQELLHELGHDRTATGKARSSCRKHLFISFVFPGVHDAALCFVLVFTVRRLVG